MVRPVSDCTKNFNFYISKLNCFFHTVKGIRIILFGRKLYNLGINIGNWRRIKIPYYQIRNNMNLNTFCIARISSNYVRFSFKPFLKKIIIIIRCTRNNNTFYLFISHSFISLTSLYI